MTRITVYQCQGMKAMSQYRLPILVFFLICNC